MTYLRKKAALQALYQGEVIAYPTESVYGIGCDPQNEQAMLKVLQIKQREWHKGMIIVAADFNQIQPYIKPVSNQVLVKLEQTWPGAVTWLLPASDDCPELLTGLHETIAVRVTAHQQTADLCNSFGSPIVSTSANLAGYTAMKQAHQVRLTLPSVDYVYAGACGGADKPSQIIDATTGTIIR